MSSPTNDRIAILLSSVGDEVASALLQQLPQSVADNMTSKLRQLERIPPDDDEVTDVIEEFNRFLEFALANADFAPAEETADAEEEDEVASFVPTDDPFEDVQRLRDYQIAGFLRNECAPTCAIVLRTLPNDRIGKIMELLPEAVRKTTFLCLQTPRTVPSALLRRIAEKTVEIASRLDRDAAEDPDSLADENTAALLRSMQRTTRSEMFATLENEKPEVAERVKSLLFVFDDLKSVTDKSVQKLLAEVDSSSLAMALKNADEVLVSRITSNLSKRARASLMEEIDLLDSVNSEAEDSARKQVCDAMARLDQAGNLEMMDS